MNKDRSRAFTRSKWFLPSFSLALGLYPTTLLIAGQLGVPLPVFGP